MPTAAASVYVQSFIQGLRPESRLTVSEWSDQYRMLSQRASAEPGRWRTARTPYLKEIMDCLSASSPWETVVFMKGAQVGATETGLNWLGYIIHHAPAPTIAVQPTVELAKRTSKQRIDPLVEESPVLKQMVRDPRSRDSGNTILSKEFPGGILVLTGANSAVGLRSMPARNLFLDEVDAYPLDVEGEGDPITLARARTRTFARKKIFLTSTPLDEGTSRIERAYEQSDQRRFFVPCPFCGHYQYLRFVNIHWNAGDPDSAHYSCERCHGAIRNYHKTVMLEQGEWRATAKGDGRTAGFHLPSHYSPVGWFSFSDSARMWEQAENANDDTQRKVFVNTVDAQTWQVRGDAPDWKRLYDQAQAEALPQDGIIPMGGLFLTAGVDVQQDRLEISTYAWGRNKESWLIDHVILPGNPWKPEVWEQLAELSNRTFAHASGIDLSIVRMAVDSGSETQTVYAWVRQQGPGRVLAIKGFDSGTAIVGVPTAVDLNWQGQKLRRAVKLWPINVSALKSELYGWLKLDSPTLESGKHFPAGYCHFPPMSEEFFRQLTAEHLITKLVKGYQKGEWQKLRDRNEALDCRIYSRAAASQFGIDRFTPRDWDYLENPVRQAIRQREEEERVAIERTQGIPQPPEPTPRAVPTPKDTWMPKKSGWFDKQR